MKKMDKRSEILKEAIDMIMRMNDKQLKELFEIWTKQMQKV